MKMIRNIRYALPVRIAMKYRARNGVYITNIDHSRGTRSRTTRSLIRISSASQSAYEILPTLADLTGR